MRRKPPPYAPPYAPPPDPPPPRPSPPGTFKCQQCGRTLPLARLYPGDPPEWWHCLECERQCIRAARDPHKVLPGFNA